MVKHRYQGIYRGLRVMMFADFRGNSSLSNRAKTCRGSRVRLEPRYAPATVFIVMIIAVTILIGPSPWQVNGGSAWADTAATPKGTLWVFTVGVSQFRNSMIDLQFADNDAQTLADTLAQRSAGVFANVKTQVIVH